MLLYLPHGMIAFHFWEICFRGRLKDNSKNCHSCGAIPLGPFISLALDVGNTHSNRANIRVVIRGVIRDGNNFSTVVFIICLSHSSGIQMLLLLSVVVSLVILYYGKWHLCAWAALYGVSQTSVLFSMVVWTWNPRRLSNIASMQTWNNCIFPLSWCRERRRLLKNRNINENQYIWTQLSVELIPMERWNLC